jgi:hypothetical protein
MKTTSRHADPRLTTNCTMLSILLLSPFGLVVVYDNNLELGWSRDLEIDGNTRDARNFYTDSSHPEDNSLTFCVLVLLMTIDVAVVIVDLSLWGCLYPSFYIQGGRGYKEGNQLSYNMISIRILYLLAYFTYIFIDIIIYALGAHHGPLESFG